MTRLPSSAAGVVVLDKPEGMTSHDVVARMRRLLGTRRVGHAGTLDPMATGVLVLAYGRGTRLLPYLQATDKHYRATIRLGWATATDDRTGEPIGEPVAVALDTSDIDAALARLTGDLQQRPSAVSAIKVDGRRAYARVRNGEQVELPARPVTVHRLERIGAPRSAVSGSLDIDVDVECSTGTYVRALARDLGTSTGCGGHLVMLRRCAVGPFGLADAHALPAVGQAPPPQWDLADAAAAVLPVVWLDEAGAAAARLGQRFAVGPNELDPAHAPGSLRAAGPGRFPHRHR